MKMVTAGFDVSVSVVTNRVNADIQKVRKRALATLRRRLAVEARRDIQREYAIKSDALRERLNVSTPRDNVVMLRGRASGVNLIYFGARQNASGVKVRVKKGGAPKQIAHAFIRSTRSGRGPFVWIRGAAGSKYTASHPSKDKYSGKHGYPIFGKFGPNVATMLKERGRPQRLADFASGVIASELARLTR